MFHFTPQQPCSTGRFLFIYIPFLLLALIFILLALFVFMFAVLGLQLFAGKYSDLVPPPRCVWVLAPPPLPHFPAHIWHTRCLSGSVGVGVFAGISDSLCLPLCVTMDPPAI